MWKHLLIHVFTSWSQKQSNNAEVGKSIRYTSLSLVIVPHLLDESPLTEKNSHQKQHFYTCCGGHLRTRAHVLLLDWGQRALDKVCERTNAVLTVQNVYLTPPQCAVQNQSSTGFIPLVLPSVPLFLFTCTAGWGSSATADCWTFIFSLLSIVTKLVQSFTAMHFPVYVPPSLLLWPGHTWKQSVRC